MGNAANAEPSPAKVADLSPPAGIPGRRAATGPPRHSESAHKKARRGSRGEGVKRRRGGRHLSAAEGDAKRAKERSLRERARRHGGAHQTKKFSLVADSLHGSTGWQGREPEEKERIWVLQAYESGEIKKTLARFHPVPCDL